MANDDMAHVTLAGGCIIQQLCRLKSGSRYEILTSQYFTAQFMMAMMLGSPGPPGYGDDVLASQGFSNVQLKIML